MGKRCKKTSAVAMASPKAVCLSVVRQGGWGISIGCEVWFEVKMVVRSLETYLSKEFIEKSISRLEEVGCTCDEDDSHLIEKPSWPTISFWSAALLNMVMRGA